ncbi:MAG: M20/M25/M40 family metallo-hydrolase [Myxococcota bacterium]|nr:M20/M25/M40 family metallo-hydrolase [Myxococcota bacterium]
MKRALAIALVVACGSSSSNRRDAGPVSNAVDSARFLADLTTISAPRPPASPHWQTVQDLCAARFEALGFTVERHQYATGVNVIGTRTGTRLPAERLLVSAHYDSVNACAGADDNATGVAATLEAARVLSLSPHDRTLVVACWDEEERGLIGSRAYATRAKAAGDRVTGHFVFEMIGYRSTAPNSQRTDPNLDAAFPAQTAEIAANEYRGDFILLIHDTGSAALAADFDAQATALALPAIALPVSDALKLAPAASGLRRSDHAPFWEQGYPSIQLTDTANFRNPHYHCAGGEDALADIDVEFATLIIKATVGATAAALDAK